MYLKKLFILLLFVYSINSFSMQQVKRWKLGHLSKGVKQKSRPRQTKTEKAKKSLFSNLFKKFHKKFNSKNTSYKQQKTGKNSFAALPILATTGFVALNISDEEKKEDHEKLKILLSQESFDQSTNDEIYALLEKYGITKEKICAFLEGFVANQRELYDDKVFRLRKKGPFYTEHGSYYDHGIRASIDDVNDGIISEKLQKKIDSNAGLTTKLDPDDITDINILKLKMSMAEDIWTLMPWILKNSIRRQEAFGIDLLNPIQISAIIRDSVLGIPIGSRWPFIMTHEDKEMVKNKIYGRLVKHAMILDKYYAALDFLPSEQRTNYMRQETGDLKHLLVTGTQKEKADNHEKLKMILDNELQILKNLKEHCKEEGCDWINDRLQVFNEAFPEYPTKIKNQNLFSPESEKSLLQRLWDNIWPSYYFPKSK